MIQSFVDKDASNRTIAYKLLCDCLFDERVDTCTYRALRYVIKRLESLGFPVDNKTMVTDQCFNVLDSCQEFIKTVKQDLFDDEQVSLLYDLIIQLADSMHVKIDKKKKHISVRYHSNFETVYEAWKLRNCGMKS